MKKERHIAPEIPTTLFNHRRAFYGLQTATCCLPLCYRRGYTHTIGMPAASKMPPSRPCSAMPTTSLLASQEPPLTNQSYLWNPVLEGLFWPRYVRLRKRRSLADPARRSVEQTRKAPATATSCFSPWVPSASHSILQERRS
jgi:hypothetical protein